MLMPWVHSVGEAPFGSGEPAFLFLLSLCWILPCSAMLCCAVLCPQLGFDSYLALQGGQAALGGGAVAVVVE